MDRTEIIGVWSFNAGYEADHLEDKQLHFYEDGTGCVVAGDEIMIRYEWAISEDGEDILMGKNTTLDGKPLGNGKLMESGATLCFEKLPRGEFHVLSFKRFSLPFGIRTFAKI